MKLEIFCKKAKKNREDLIPVFLRFLGSFTKSIPDEALRRLVILVTAVSNEAEEEDAKIVLRPEAGPGRVRCFVSVLLYFGRSDTSRIPSPVPPFPPEEFTFPLEEEEAACGVSDEF